MVGLVGRPIGHTRSDGSVHDLRDHLQGTADRSSAFAAKFDSAAIAQLIGLWHDLGKYHPAFQKKMAGALTSALNDEDTLAAAGANAKVDHSTAGALLCAQRLGGPAGLAAALSIASHHAGLPDPSPFKQRLQTRAALLPQTLPHVDAEVRDLDTAAARQLPSHVPAGDGLATEFWTRMLFSALVDADFLDTEAFMSPGQSAQRPTATDLEPLRARLAAHVDALSQAAPPSPVNEARRDVLAQCRARAADAPGLFTLTVPTGGGKTLAAMSFALEHAVHHGLDRVIVAVPYTAIIEQNANVYRAVFGDDAVLEHTSSVEPDHETFRNKLASENWDAPIIVTTTVQLFESLHARRTSKCRKLHRLARSVIVLDEAQTLPPQLLPTILDMLGRLARDYGATVVSCTATQPALARTDRFVVGLEGMREIVDAPEALFEQLRRVDVELPARDAPPVDWPTLAGLLAREPDVLAIVHRRADAHALTEALDAELGGVGETIHLSALQCPEHRTQIVADVKARKRRGEAVRVVATQLVEAGVDLDFAVVYRALGGLDALAQAAGRCNREGRRARGRFVVFRAPTEPPPGVLTRAFEAARRLLLGQPDVDVLSPGAQRRFFELLYEQFDVRRDPSGLLEDRRNLRFETTAERFRMIEDDWSAPVVVPFGDGPRLVAAAAREFEQLGFVTRATRRRLQRHTVSIAKRLHDKALARGALVRVAETFTAVQPGLAAYDLRYGLDVTALASAEDEPVLVVE
jgi:CRISPR-associated endonuclease/helicase Cas3